MIKKSLSAWLVMLLAALPCAAGAMRPAGQAAEVTLQTVEPFSYVCIPVKGSFAKIQEAVPNLLSEMAAQNTAPTGPLLGIYYNSPEEVDSQALEWEVGFPVTPMQAIRTPLVLKKWTFTQVAASVHKGPYSDVGKTIVKMTEWMDANGWVPAGPFLERYMDMNPSEMRPEDLRTEIWIPCRKK
jgi:effector-binding domain-containing protein